MHTVLNVMRVSRLCVFLRQPGCEEIQRILTIGSTFWPSGGSSRVFQGGSAGSAAEYETSKPSTTCQLCSNQMKDVYIKI